MQKFASLVLIVALLAAMLSVFAIPASASSTGLGSSPAELKPERFNSFETDDTNIFDSLVSDGINIAQSGTYTVKELICYADDVLVIGADTNITVSDFCDCSGTIIVCGSLNLEVLLIWPLEEGLSSIKVVDGYGKLPGRIPEGIEYIDHFFVCGECICCGEKCSHANGYVNKSEEDPTRVCRDCRMPCVHQNGYVYCCRDCGANMEHLYLGSTLSEGGLTIIVGVAAAVVFGLGGFFLGTKKKKKTALADGENKDE